MKAFLCLVFIFSLGFTSFAQQTPIADSTVSRSVLGIELSTVAYEVKGKPKYKATNSIVPFVALNYGYRLNKRTILQVGLGYGVNALKSYSSRFVSADSIYDVIREQHTHAFVTPVTLKFTPFNPHRRLQLFANASVVPVFGRIEAKESESFGDAQTILYDETISSVTMIATVGLTLNYKISKRLDGYLDGLVWYKNLSYKSAEAFKNTIPVKLGLNYNLNK